MLKYIRERGAKAGLALKPATGLEGVTAWMAQADLMLAMTVEPGFGGQHLEPEVIAKIRQIRDSGYAGYIEADGGIREDNLQTLIDNGLTVAVMGTALFGHPEMKAEIRRLHKMEGVPCRDA